LAIWSAASAVAPAGDVLERLRQRDPTAEQDPGVLRLLGMAAATVGAFVLAESFFASAVAGLRQQGRLALLAQALVLHAWTARETHGLRLAVIHAEEGARLAHETGQPLFAAGAAVTLAAAATMRGDERAAEAFAADAERATASTEAGDVLADLQLIRGIASLADGRHAEALAQLRRVYDPADEAFHPVMGSWAVADFVEAAVFAGREREGRAVFDRLAVQLDGVSSPRFELAMLRARPWLAEEADVDGLYRAALSADYTGWPYVRARLNLAHGEWLRRQRRVIEARDQLRLAREAFDAFGAVRWGERARRELRASGEVSRVRPPDAFDQLTAQELQIARLAARGLSNRAIGEHLYLSPRTIGSHLYRVFPKLGITSRAELAPRLPVDA
jgi:ATP/maltotriose-dependent transcriptional regulator MalT